jgi:integrase
MKIADEIYADYLSEEIKPLEDYKPKHTVEAKLRSVTLDDLQIAVLWEKYVAFKIPQVAETTVRLNYSRVESHINKNPYKLISQASEAFIYLTENNSPETAKRIITQLNACCNWGVKMRIIKKNPFKGMASEIKVSKSKTQLPDSEENDFLEIDPFTDNEVKMIIKSFQNHQKYNHYEGFVKFLFLTGCRTSEAIGLRWKDISKDLSMITFQNAIVCASGKLITKRLKTQDFRKFPCNSQLREFINSIKHTRRNVDDYVFKSLTGKVIRADVFNGYVWNTCENHGITYIGIVRQLANNGAMRYRPQYQTRHTFITNALNAGMEVKDVAALVGNSPEVIYKHYAGVRISDIAIPEIQF